MSLLSCTFPTNRSFHRISDLEQALGLTPGNNVASRSHDDENNYYVQIDLPGVRKEDVTIKVEDDQLKVSATRHLNQKGESKSVALSRAFVLPEDVDLEKITAEQKDGVLSLTLPKKEESKPKTVNISVN